MSINFNPSVSVKPTPHVDLRKTSNVGEGKDYIHRNLENLEGAATFDPNYTKPAALNALSPDVMTAAELVARANIVIAQQYGTPPEIASSMDIADMFCERALKLENLIKTKAEKILENYAEEKEISVNKNGKRKIVEENGRETMFEYAPNGELLRQSSFKDGVLQSAEEFRADGRKNVLTMSGGKVSEYLEGLYETEEGRMTEKYFTFNNNDSMYFEDYNDFSDGSSSASKWVWLQNGQMCAYYEDMENSSDGSSTIGLHLRYDKDGVLYEYAEEIVDGITLGKHFMLEDGKWIEKNKAA